MTAATKSVAFPIVALAILFAILRTGWGEAASQATAWCIGVASAGILDILQVEFLRNGSELRSVQTGHALAVTRACDGLGIFAAFLATRFAVDQQIPGINATKRIAAAFGVIQVLNIIRVLILFTLLPAGSPAFSLFHSFVFPLASSAVVLVLLIADGHSRIEMISMRKCQLWLLFASLFGVGWYFVAAWISALTMVPVANLYLRMFESGLAKYVLQESAAFALQTRLILSQNPLTLATTAFSPEAFSLATPLLLASLSLARQRFALIFSLLAIYLLGAPLAMAIAATMQAHILANANPSSLIENGMMGALPYKRPSDVTWAMLAVLQNTLVYFNLFALPMLLLLAGSRNSSSANERVPNKRVKSPNRKPLGNKRG